MGEIEFTTRLWRRSQSSWASTVPKGILAARGVDADGDVELEWSINTDTRSVEVEFSEVDDG